MKAQPHLTLEQIEELDGERFDRELRRSVRNAWKSASKYKRLALQLGVGGIFDATAVRQGEYIYGTLPSDWITSETRRSQIDRITKRNNLPVILINSELAFVEDGIPQVITHEIGHHIDQLANGNPKRTPSKSFASAFKQAGFHEYTHAWNDLFSELIAEALNQYLRGRKLNAVLLAEVSNVLAKLTRKHQRIIQAFRNKHRKQIEGRS